MFLRDSWVLSRVRTKPGIVAKGACEVKLPTGLVIGGTFHTIAAHEHPYHRRGGVYRVAPDAASAGQRAFGAHPGRPFDGTGVEREGGSRGAVYAAAAEGGGGAEQRGLGEAVRQDLPPGRGGGGAA